MTVNGLAGSQTLVEPATLNFQATSNSAGRVEYQNSGTTVAMGLTAPFAASWKNVPKGVYYISCKQFSPSGSLGYGNSMTITVTGSVTPPPPIDTNPPPPPPPPPPTTNQPPSALVSLPGGSAYTAPATFDVDAHASDPDGTISKVELYINGKFAGSAVGTFVTFSIYEPAGTYSINIVATDNAGAKTTSNTVTVTVGSAPPPPPPIDTNPPPPATNNPPTVKITSPTSGQTFTERVAFGLTTQVSDVDGSVVWQTCYINNDSTLALKGTNNGATAWNLVLPAGSYSAYVIARDNLGATTKSAAVTFTVTGTTPPPPPPPPIGPLTYTGCLYLNFNGGTYSGTMWNGVTTFAASQMSADEQNYIVESVQNDYSFTMLEVTRDPAEFAKFPANKRLQCNVTTTYSWYPNAGGVSYVGSFNWGDGTPNWVFSPLLGYSTKMVGEACTHECGHALGLSHSNDFGTNCTVVTTYYGGLGTGPIGWAPFMGNSYYKTMSTPSNGEPFINYGCTAAAVDQVSIILGYAGQRADDYPNTVGAIVNNNPFPVTGIIETNNDVDALKIPSNTNISVQPYTNDKGENPNLHLKVGVYDANKNLIATYTNDTSLGVIFASGSGVYITVETRANVNHSRYGQLGKYVVTTSTLAAFKKPITLGDNLVKPE